MVSFSSSVTRVERHTQIASLCRKEKSTVPFLIGCCVREVEKRGINEVGIYRISGSSSDVQRLRKSFESNPYEAEQLLKEVDVNAVAHLLKLYLRELPEALFTDELYPNFFEALSKYYKLTHCQRFRPHIPLPARKFRQEMIPLPCGHSA